MRKTLVVAAIVLLAGCASTSGEPSDSAAVTNASAETASASTPEPEPTPEPTTPAGPLKFGDAITYEDGLTVIAIGIDEEDLNQDNQFIEPCACHVVTVQVQNNTAAPMEEFAFDVQLAFGPAGTQAVREFVLEAGFNGFEAPVAPGAVGDCVVVVLRGDRSFGVHRRRDAELGPRTGVLVDDGAMKQALVPSRATTSFREGTDE